MPRTLSEKIFEDFCKHKGIRCKPVKVDRNRTPDYDIFLTRRKVVVEVKEITPNAIEKASEAELKAGRPTEVTLTPGQRVRGKIADAALQIKTGVQRRYPGLLVLFDSSFVAGHLDPYQIRVAMYGFETIVLAVPENPRVSAYPIDRKYGPRRKMTPTHNTSISAIGVLTTPQKGKVELTIYHNIYALVPLPYALFAEYRVRQFKLAQARQGTIAGWEEIVG